MPALYDAHIHLADAALLSHWEDIQACYQTIGLANAVVVGTCPRDWPAVLKLAKQDHRIIPAVGLHPWKVNHAPTDWQSQFLDALDSGTPAIGEIGLDKWIPAHDLERQQAAFRFQLAEAAKRDLPVSIHCLKAIGPMMETLRTIELPQRGFHLHALNGPIELIQELVSLGAYFSFNAGQLIPENSKTQTRIRAIPTDRLLVETDAPDFLPPPELREFTLTDSKLCHPANLRRGYEAIAAIRQITYDALAEEIESNFIHYFKCMS